MEHLFPLQQLPPGEHDQSQSSLTECCPSTQPGAAPPANAVRLALPQRSANATVAPAREDVPLGGRPAVGWGWFSHGLQGEGRGSGPAPELQLCSSAGEEHRRAAGTRPSRTAGYHHEGWVMVGSPPELCPLRGDSQGTVPACGHLVEEFSHPQPG